MDPKEISDWQHEEFYRYVAQAYDKPRYTLHYRADAPLNIRSIFYVPESVRSVWICIWTFFTKTLLKFYNVELIKMFHFIFDSVIVQ